jgi:hypothetical protein
MHLHNHNSKTYKYLSRNQLQIKRVNSQFQISKTELNKLYKIRKIQGIQPKI